MNFKKLYKIDTKGKLRVWWIEHDHEKYRVHSGIDGGAIVESGWKFPVGKNVGKANETTVEQQVLNEVESLYTKQSEQGGYSYDKENAGDSGYFEPMLANKYEPSKLKFPVYSQPKLDGIRCILKKDGMWTRQGKPIVSCPHIIEAYEYFFTVSPDAVVDGELYNHNLKNDFEKIVSLVRKTKPTKETFAETKDLVKFFVYDAVMPNDILENRIQNLRKATDAFGVSVMVATDFVENQDDLDSLFASYIENGYEGQMIRLPGTYYENKRSKNLLKRKEFDDAEFEIVEAEEGVGNWSGYAKSIRIRLENGIEQSAGMRGTQEFAKQILKDAAKLIGTKVTVRYQGRTSDGKLRFPVVTYFWYGDRDV